MAVRLELHELSGDKRAKELSLLVERLYREGRRLVVWVEDEGRRTILDDYLWTFDRLSFVPHRAWAPGMDEFAEPVVLVGEPINPNGADVLVVGDDLPPDEWVATFTEVHDLIPPGDEGAQRRQWWEQIAASQ